MTAVEWLVSILNKEGFAPVLTNEEIKQAKEMEKQQIVDACYFGSQNLPYEIKDKSEQYYNETYLSSQDKP
jgi:ribosomal protein S6